MIKRMSLIFLLYLGLAIVLTWPLAAVPSDHVINAGDPLFYAWNLMHNVRSITNGFTGILDTNMYYPTTNTLAFSDSLAAQTIFAAPIIWLTNNPILAINVYTLLTFPIAGSAVYLLVTSLVKHQWAGGLMGAMFAFSYPRFGQMSHLPALSSQWFPFFLYGLYWFLVRGKFTDLAIALISFLLLLGSTVYFGVFAIIIAIVTITSFIALWMIKKPELKMAKLGFRHLIIWTILLLVITSITSFILVFPYIRLKAEHPEITRSLEESSARAAYQKDYTSVTSTSLLAGFLKTNEGERTLYPTIALLLLAGFGISRWKKKEYRFPIVLFSAISLTGLVLSFGPERPFSIGSFDTGYITLPYAYLYRVFPLLQILRVPARFSIVFLLGLSILAGFGAVRFMSSPRRRGSGLKYQIPVFTGMTILFLLEIWQRPLPLVKVPTYANAPLVYQWLREQPDVKAIIELPIGKIEGGMIPIGQQVMLRYEDITEGSPLVAETYRAYFAGFHDKRTINGYSGYVAQSFHDAVDTMDTFPSASSINYLRSQGVSYIIVHPWQLTQQKRGRYILDPNHPELITKFAALDGDIVYEIR